jgi:hypothetical protein
MFIVLNEKRLVRYSNLMGSYPHKHCLVLKHRFDLERKISSDSISTYVNFSTRATHQQHL